MNSRPYYGDLILKVWCNISANRFEIDSEFWRNLMACLRKGSSKSDVSLLLWRPLFEGLNNISARFEINSEILKKFDGMFTKRESGWITMKHHLCGKRNLEKTSYLSFIAKFVSFCVHLKSINESNGNLKKKSTGN